MATPTLYTVLSPSLLHLYEVDQAVVVIIDVFRATSTIAAALHNGAEKVIPVDSVQGAIEIGLELGAVTAGERDGQVADGLQHGNSPLEYPSTFIGGKILVLTTTNGTRLLHMALRSNANDIITGSFANIGAVCDYLIAAQKNVLLCCAAWKDKVNSEDTLFAGAVATKVADHFQIQCDATLMAQTLYQQVKPNLWAFTQQTTHFARLSRYGLEKDMQWCLTENIANTGVIYREGALWKMEN